MIVILGIESTCDETAAAIIEEDNNRETEASYMKMLPSNAFSAAICIFCSILC